MIYFCTFVNVGILIYNIYLINFLYKRFEDRDYKYFSDISNEFGGVKNGKH